jgi:hypothetical protein
MREGISIEVSAADCERLAAVVADRNGPKKHVWRARIILATQRVTVCAALGFRSLVGGVARRGRWLAA